MSAQTFREQFEQMLRESPDICYESERCVALAGAVAALEIASEMIDDTAREAIRLHAAGVTDSPLFEGHMQGYSDSSIRIMRLASELGGERRG